MSHRFFIPPEALTPPTVTLPADVARQINTVLRMQPGDEIVVLDDSGRGWQVTLTEVSRRTVAGQITAALPQQGEPTLHLTLYQGTLKGQKFEWVLQKGTELGVSRFVPTICQRSVVRNRAALQKKESRRQQIIREAAEQSGRSKLPQLAAPLPLATALKQATGAGPTLLAWEDQNGGTTRLKALLATIEPPPAMALFIGPEGGFAPEEVSLAQRFGGHLVTLGPRILRSETAGLAACAAIMYAWDEW